jgi:undecaprenyl diphosphate synthase
MARIDQEQPASHAPLHVAVVMDGNGRWAKRRGLPRQLGHPKGVDAIRRVVDVAEIVERAERRTAGNDRFFLQVAFNYGGRADLVDAARALAADVASGRLAPEEISDELLQAKLSTEGVPDPDLVVRTSGEQRLSNFLLWESAYSEFVFQDVLWPDYSADHLRAAIDEYNKRERRYGGAVADDVLAAG